MRVYVDPRAPSAKLLELRPHRRLLGLPFQTESFGEVVESRRGQRRTGRPLMQGSVQMGQAEVGVAFGLRIGLLVRCGGLPMCQNRMYPRREGPRPRAWAEAVVGVNRQACPHVSGED